MKQRKRIYYSAAQREEIWDRWRNGESMHDIAATYDRFHTSVQKILTANGGIRPLKRTRADVALTLAERETISRGLACKLSIRSIARQLQRAPSTVSREISRNGGAVSYRANKAEKTAWDRALRPKQCKLASRPELCKIITEKLLEQWSPEQISGWLQRQYPDSEYYQVSHETIYKSLFVQARGVLKKELLACLRSGRKCRRPKKMTLKGKNLGTIPNAIPIRDRPASIEDRAIPGHWEGDLIEGSNRSCIATLVERHSRFTMLVKLADKKFDTVIDALIEQSQRLPSELYKSLTWDRGAEMSRHERFTVATDINIYFCDPQSPWQRGTNENTNRLLRDYLPKGTDLSVHSQEQLDEIARQLNQRPRKTLEFETPSERFNQCVALTL